MHLQTTLICYNSQHITLLCYWPSSVLHRKATIHTLPLLTTVSAVHGYILLFPNVFLNVMLVISFTHMV